MPTGMEHRKITKIEYDRYGSVIDSEDESCRCMIGEDHEADGVVIINDSSDGNDESLGVEDASLIWSSNGMDEDYTFGYTDDELRSAM